MPPTPRRSGRLRRTTSRTDDQTTDDEHSDATSISSADSDIKKDSSKDGIEDSSVNQDEPSGDDSDNSGVDKDEHNGDDSDYSSVDEEEYDEDDSEYSSMDEEEYYEKPYSGQDERDVEMDDYEARPAKQATNAKLPTSRQSILQHLPASSSRKRKLEDNEDDEIEDDVFDLPIRAKRPYRQRDLRKLKTAEEDLAMDDAPSNDPGDNNAACGRHSAVQNHSQGAQHTSPKRSSKVPFDSTNPNQSAHLFKEGRLSSELEANLQIIGWKRSDINSTVFNFPSPSARIQIYDNGFTLLSTKKRFHQRWYNALAQFIHKEEGLTDDTGIVVAVKQVQKADSIPKRAGFESKSYKSMNVARLVQECGERNPKVSTDPDPDSKYPQQYATRQILLARLREDDKNNPKPEKPYADYSESDNTSIIKCPECGEKKPYSDFVRFHKSNKIIQKRQTCNNCATLRRATLLLEKQDILHERIAFMQDNYPEALNADTLSTADLRECTACRKFHLKGVDRDLHWKVCSKLHPWCKHCKRHVPIEEMETDHYSVSRCEEVKVQKELQRQAPKETCNYCRVRISTANDQYSLHLPSCRQERTFCTTCEKWVKKEHIHDHRCKPVSMRWWCGHCKRLIREQDTTLHKSQGCAQRFSCIDCQRHFNTLGEREDHECLKDPSCWKCGKGGFAKGERAVHVAKCLFRSCYRCGIHGLSVDEYRPHIESCPKRRCQRCGVLFDSAEAKEEHDCRHIRCHQCGKVRIPLDLYKKHLEDCDVRRCGRCGLRVSEPEYLSHFNGCTFKRHSGCGARLPAHELGEHIANCPYHWCYKCFATKIHYSVFSSHRLTCEYELCGGCNRRFLVADNHNCGQRMCNKCVRKMPTAKYIAHKASCSERLHLKRLALEQDNCCGWLLSHKSEPCPNEPYEGSGMCAEHAQKYENRTSNTAMEKVEFQRVLFTNDVLLKTLSNFRKIDRAPTITEWMNTLDSSSKRMFLADIEGNTNFTTGEFSNVSPYHTFQLTIMNGEGDIVVPQCVINHEHLTKEELFQRSGASNSFIIGGVFRKYYGEPSDEPATGRDGVRSRTWRQIANQIRRYIKKQKLPKSNPILALVDWSAHHVDLMAIKAGLTSVKMGHLLPAKPIEGADSPGFNLLVWWRVFRGVLGFVRGSKHGFLHLSLANFFVILYPGERKLAARAHDSEPDVQMLYRVLQFTRILWQEGRVDGRLSGHLTRRSVAGPSVDKEMLKKIEEEETLAISKEGEIERQEAYADEQDDFAVGNEPELCDYDGLIEEWLAMED